MHTILVPLASLVPGHRNPRKVKPDREAHRQLVASIRAIGLLHPLTVRPNPDNAKQYLIIAGKRRWSALKEIHRGNGHDVKVPCQLRKVDDPTADKVALSENFPRVAMHPLDEAEAFAKVAAEKPDGVAAVVAEFGVTERYVKQRMKLATLAREIKMAYRNSEIDTATAEAFAAVPEERQRQAWMEVGGKPRHAEHVRNIIANGWIDASLALFDVDTLPADAVSRDLFSERVLIERAAFMEAQTQALEQQRQQLLEEGWSAAVAGQHEEVAPQLHGMTMPEREFDAKSTRKLAKIAKRRQQLEHAMNKMDDGDEAALARVQQKLDTLEDAEQNIIRRAPEYFSEATKAVGTAFVTLDATGEVHRVYGVPHPHPQRANGDGSAEGAAAEQPKPPTADDLHDRQKATAFTHHTLAVREALLDNPLARKRLLVMILHENVRAEALALRHDANGVTLHATQEEGFASPVWDRLTERHRKIDPLVESVTLTDEEAYAKVSKLSAAKLDALIDLLLVQSLTAHAVRPTPLVHILGRELKVDVRKHWRPDASWLAHYQKCQLADLLRELHGPIYDPARETRKKSELVQILATLFAHAAEGKLDDKPLAERVNCWLPVNLRQEQAAEKDGRREAA